MPKKTKKEKLLAQQHRSHFSPVATHQSAKISATDSSHISQFSLSLPSQGIAESKTLTISLDEYQFMKKDLIKTVILTAAILIGEVLLTKFLPR